MPSFEYTARDNSGAAVVGTLVADSVAEVTRLLRGEGKYPTAIRAAGVPVARTQRAPRGIAVPRREVIQLATQLSIMVDTGVTLSEALNCIAVQAEQTQVKLLLTDLSALVQAGTDFSVACAKHPRSFPRVFVALIKASERTGMMGKLLNARYRLHARRAGDYPQGSRGADLSFDHAFVRGLHHCIFAGMRVAKVYAHLCVQGRGVADTH